MFSLSGLLHTLIMSAKSLKESDLKEMSHYVGGSWEPLAEALGISKEDVDCIKVDYRYNIQDQIFRMLLDWKQSADKPVTMNDFLNKVESYTPDQKSKKIKLKMEKLKLLAEKIGLFWF